MPLAEDMVVHIPIKKTDWALATSVGRQRATDLDALLRVLKYVGSDRATMTDVLSQAITEDALTVAGPYWTELVDIINALGSDYTRSQFASALDRACCFMERRTSQKAILASEKPGYFGEWTEAQRAAREAKTKASQAYWASFQSGVFTPREKRMRELRELLRLCRQNRSDREVALWMNGVVVEREPGSSLASGYRLFCAFHHKLGPSYTADAYAAALFWAKAYYHGISPLFRGASSWTKDEIMKDKRDVT